MRDLSAPLEHAPLQPWFLPVIVPKVSHPSRKWDTLVGHFTVVSVRVNPVCPAVPRIVEKILCGTVRSLVENGVSFATRQLTRLMALSRCGKRVGQLPSQFCPMSQKKNRPSKLPSLSGRGGGRFG